MREAEKVGDIKIMAAMHGAKLGDEDKKQDKNEINKKAAQMIMREF